MRRYACPNCGHEVYFENTQCVNCGCALHFASGRDTMVSAPGDERSCANRDPIDCNWLCASDRELCSSCALTLTIPDASNETHVARWARLEGAKRLLFYSLIKFALPLASRCGSENLRFELLADEPAADGTSQHVLTGHDNGLITINIAEADDAIREKNRAAMHEPYRTLVGHFRHEVGHFYWDVLVRDAGMADAFRAVFGDERRDYGDALKRHYADGPPAGWQDDFVSAYATCHPWEDFAETWAHYFHMVDGLETAQAYRLLQTGDAGSQNQTFYAADHFQLLADHWMPLTVAMNSVNRSIGNHDFYPFVLSDSILAKLRFVHLLIHERRSVS